MLGIGRSQPEGQAAIVSAGFEHALNQEVLRTELVRVKALIVTAGLLLIVLWTVDLIDPRGLDHIWRGQFRPNYLTRILVPFVLFEIWVLRAHIRRLKQDQDIAVVRRYLGALIETSLPTVALAVHIDNMGPVQALGFVMPMAYFIFIILSTLRLDFWLSTFTGLVAASELFAMAMFYHPQATTDPPPDIWYHASRSMILLISGVLAGAVGLQLRRQFAASIKAATARDHVTNLFGQHVSPQVVERLIAEGTESTSDIRSVAVMFVDFRSFTEGARSRSPQEVVDRLDGAFAPLETPEAAQHAVAAAREMLAAMGGINAASSWPLRVGIGIHFGEVVAGNIGSPRRKEYTVIGDTVNFASRLEALNKEFGSQLLISAAVHHAVGEGVRDAVSLGEVAVRGYEAPMAVWQLG
jgi:adenylate cyclase